MRATIEKEREEQALRPVISRPTHNPIESLGRAASMRTHSEGTYATSAQGDFACRTASNIESLHLHTIHRRFERLLEATLK